MSDAQLILVAGALTAAGLLASLAAARLRIPSLVLFLGLGMAIGSDGLGWIDFGDYRLARTIGVIALSLILFEGGLKAGIAHIRPVLLPALSLAVVGTVATAVIAGLFAAWLFDLSVVEGVLLGSIVCATDGAAVFALLRGSALRQRVARTLEGESGLNDPFAVLLVIGLINWLQDPGYRWADLAALFARELAIGAAIGVVVAWLAVQALRRIRLGNEAGYPVATLSAAALAYGGAASLHGSGFLAVYIAGLALGSFPFPAQRTAVVFHEGLAALAQVSMFLVLGLLVFPGDLGGVGDEAILLAIVLIFVARPIATLAATVRARFTLSERAILAWAGFRGAVPVVLATFPVIAGIGHSREFFNIVFFAVLVSTLLQGATFEPLARLLGVTADPAAPVPRPSSPRARVATTRPWTPADGDPAYPRAIGGIAVSAQLLSRIDEPGAVVRLADGRYAFTGRIVSVGSASALRKAAERRLARAGNDRDRAWWRQVIGAVAHGDA